jgi:hypothetical protein
LGWSGLGEGSAAGRCGDLTILTRLPAASGVRITLACLDEAPRQLAEAAHDALVACDSISLGDLDWAHANAIIARAEADAAERVLRAALGTGEDLARPPVKAGLAQWRSSRPDTSKRALSRSGTTAQGFVTGLTKGLRRTAPQ